MVEVQSIHSDKISTQGMYTLVYSSLEMDIHYHRHCVMDWRHSIACRFRNERLYRVTTIRPRKLCLRLGMEDFVVKDRDLDGKIELHA